MSKRRIIDIVGLALMAVAAVFLVRRVISLDVDMSAILEAKNAALIGAVALVGVVAIMNNAFGWRLCLGLFADRKIPFCPAFSAYAKANVMKYLPGNVGHYAGRQLFGAQMGLGQMDLAMASVMELGYSALAMVLCATVFSAGETLAIIRERVSWGVLLGAGAAMLAVVCALAFLLRKNRYVQSLLKLFKTGRFWGTLALCAALNILGSLVVVSGYVALMGLHTPLEIHMLPRLISANFVAIFAGYIVPGVPGGLGVREAVLTALLSPYIPEKSVLIAAFSSRIAMILTDLLTVPVSGFFAARAKGSKEVKPDETAE